MIWRGAAKVALAETSSKSDIPSEVPSLEVAAARRRSHAARRRILMTVANGQSVK